MDNILMLLSPETTRILDEEEEEEGQKNDMRAPRFPFSSLLGVASGPGMRREKE